MLTSPTERAMPREALRSWRAWTPALACLGLTGAALCAIFWSETIGAFHVWSTSTAYNHCFLILPVAIYIAWHNRASLAGIRPRPGFSPMLLIVPLSALWLLAATLGVLELRQFMVMAMFQVIALCIVGWGVYRRMLTPFLYLFFLVPSGYFLVPWLQDFTAWFVVVSLRLLHVPVYWDHTLIEIPAGSFVVAEACAGLRFLVASVAFGVLFATLTYRSWTRRCVFIALSIVIPIIANGLRALGILLLAEALDSATAATADHIIYGWIFFSMVTLVLIVVGTSFSDRDNTGTKTPSAVARFVPGPDMRPTAFVAVAVLGLALAVIGPAYAQLLSRHGSEHRLADLAPPVVPGWTRTDGALLWKPVIADPDREFLDTFNDGKASVIRYIALYETRPLHDNVVRADNEIADWHAWHLGKVGTVRITLAGRPVSVETTEISRGTIHFLIWHFYVIDGRIVTGRISAKIAQLRDLMHSSGTAAFVAVGTRASDDPRAAAAVLRRFLADASLVGYVDKLSAR